MIGKKKLIAAFSMVFFLGLFLCAEEEKLEPGKWTGDAALSLSITSGNTQTSSVAFSFAAKRPFPEKLELENSGFFLLSKISGTTNAESMGLGSRLNWKHSDRFFSYYELQAVRDRFKNYDYRILPNVGVGYKVHLSEKGELSFTAGLAEVFTKYHDSGERDSYAGLTLGDKFSWKLSPTAELSQQLVINAEASDLNHYFARLEISLSAALSNQLALKLTFVDNYDNEPVGEGIEKNDIHLMAGISLKH